MSHKIVAIVKQHPHVQALIKEVDQVEGHFQQRREFLKKQIEDLKTAHIDAQKPLKNRLNAYLVEIGVMPEDYTPQKYHTHVDDELGVVILCDGDHKRPSIEKVLAGLIGIETND